MPFLQHTQDFLTEAWDSVVDTYLSHVAGMHHTTRDEMKTIMDDFKERFGKEGNTQLTAVITSPDLNGGKDYDEEKMSGFYPGLKYSLPVSFYFMRRALDRDERKYRLFRKDVGHMFEKDGEEASDIPTKAFMKALVAPYLETLALHTQNDDHDLDDPHEHLDAD